MNTEVIHRTYEETHAGRMTFPQVVGELMGVGVESYHADLVCGETTYYLPDGETHLERATLSASAISQEYSEAGLVAAIRGAQADAIRYPEFLRLACAAGTVAYRVFLTGRRVVYFGRHGEVHVEEFPGSKA